jgi:hypothetical protein
VADFTTPVDVISSSFVFPKSMHAAFFLEIYKDAGFTRQVESKNIQPTPHKLPTPGLRWNPFLNDCRPIYGGKRSSKRQVLASFSA